MSRLLLLAFLPLCLTACTEKYSAYERQKAKCAREAHAGAPRLSGSAGAEGKAAEATADTNVEKLCLSNAGY